MDCWDSQSTHFFDDSKLEGYIDTSMGEPVGEREGVWSRRLHTSHSDILDALRLSLKGYQIIQIKKLRHRSLNKIPQVPAKR